MKFTIKFDPKALKKLSSLSTKIQKQILKKIHKLSNDPRPANSSHLKSDHSKLYIRSGDYRIIYTVRDKEVLVLVLQIGNRKEIYKIITRT